MQSKQIEDIVEFAVVTISNYCTTSTTKENINKIGLIVNIQNFVRDCTSIVI